jgi:hypothetical protein
MTQEKWKVLYKTLRVIGFAGCALVFSILTALVSYYSVTRPHLPQPAKDWTVRLYWSVSPPSYGTFGENEFLFSLHRWFFVFFTVIALGEAVRIYKLKSSGG